MASSDYRRDSDSIGPLVFTILHLMLALYPLSAFIIHIRKCGPSGSRLPSAIGIFTSGFCLCILVFQSIAFIDRTDGATQRRIADFADMAWTYAEMFLILTMLVSVSQALQFSKTPTPGRLVMSMVGGFVGFSLPLLGAWRLQDASLGSWTETAMLVIGSVIVTSRLIAVLLCWHAVRVAADDAICARATRRHGIHFFLSMLCPSLKHERWIEWKPDLRFEIQVQDLADKRRAFLVFCAAAVYAMIIFAPVFTDSNVLDVLGKNQTVVSLALATFTLERPPVNAQERSYSQGSSSSSQGGSRPQPHTDKPQTQQEKLPGKTHSWWTRLRTRLPWTSAKGSSKVLVPDDITRASDPNASPFDAENPAHDQLFPGISQVSSAPLSYPSSLASLYSKLAGQGYLSAKSDRKHSSPTLRTQRSPGLASNAPGTSGLDAVKGRDISASKAPSSAALLSIADSRSKATDTSMCTATSSQKQMPSSDSPNQPPPMPSNPSLGSGSRISHAKNSAQAQSLHAIGSGEGKFSLSLLSPRSLAGCPQTPVAHTRHQLSSLARRYEDPGGASNALPSIAESSTRLDSSNTDASPEVMCGDSEVPVGKQPESNSILRSV